MKNIRLMIALLAIAAMVLACQGTPAELEYFFVSTTPTAQVQNLPAATQQSTGSGLQVPWTPAAFTPVANGLVDWDHLKLMGSWVEGPGLAPNVNVLYVQSGTPNSLTLPNLPFVVPTNQHLIFGAYKGKITINGPMAGTYEYSNGFYAAIPGGTTVTELVVTDGFALLAKDTDSQNEFCARVAQAYAENWAHDRVYHSTLWRAPVCDGIYSVPLDSDR